MEIKYIAKDGKPFDSEMECVAHELALDKEAVEEAEILNQFCKFFDSDGNQFKIDATYDESKIYGVSIKCPGGEAYDIINIFSKRFDDLNYALQASDFGMENEIILVYDWTGEHGGGWAELDFEQQDFHKFVNKVMGWA